MKIDFKSQRGLAQIPILIGLVIMVVAIPIAMNLVQKVQENRSKATEESDAAVKVAVCPKKSLGDANCDGHVTEVDYNIWLQELKGIKTTKTADFDGEDGVDIKDFTTWNTNLEATSNNKIKLIFDSEDTSLISPENLQKWNDRLNMAYDSYAELTGYTPYNGGQISVQSVKCDKSSGWYYENWACQYWAWGGQFIGWSKAYVKDELGRVNNNDDWSFGILHEIGHDFDRDSWNFDAELMANFKMAYFIETNNAKVAPGYFRNYYIGSQIDDYYLIGYNDALSSNNYNNDFLTYVLLRIKDNIGGWATYKQVFRNVSAKSFGSNQEKLVAFLNEMDSLSPNGNAKALFSDVEKRLIELKFGKVF